MLHVECPPVGLSVTPLLKMCKRRDTELLADVLRIRDVLWRWMCILQTPKELIDGPSLNISIGNGTESLIGWPKSLTHHPGPQVQAS
jgi:hypothetical protein